MPSLTKIRQTSIQPAESRKLDLDNSTQIEALVRTFYGRVQNDDLLGPVFVDQAQVDWDEHIQKLTAFWCALELGIPGFRGAPTQKHSALSSAVPFQAEHFERWVFLFHDTIDHGWHGPHAQSIKNRAEMIARAQSRMVRGAEAWGGKDDFLAPNPRTRIARLTLAGALTHQSSSALHAKN